MAHKRVTGLSKLIRALQNAVIKAQDLVRNQHLNTLRQHIDDDGKVKTLELQVPVPGDEGAFRKITVPTLALMPASGIKLEKMKMEFDVEIGGLDEHECDDDCDHEMSIEMRRGMFSRNTKAKVELVFKGTEAPEGFLKLNDELEKFL